MAAVGGRAGMTATAEIPGSIREATEHQPAARAALAAGLDSPAHAYLLVGPAGLAASEPRRGRSPPSS